MAIGSPTVLIGLDLPKWPDILCYLQSMVPGNSFSRWRSGAEEGTQRHNLGNAEETRGNTISSPVAAVGVDIEMANSGHEAVLRNPETQAESISSSYTFLRTPKKLGEKLLPNDVDPPEGWGMYFEEGLKVSRLFMFILFLYLSGTLVFAIVWYRAFGMAGPQSGFGAFGVSSWMVGLMSIITTVCFKWAE